MTRLIEWLLDLRDIRLGRDAPVYLRWDHPFQAWLVFGFGLIALAWIAVVYSRERTGVFRRILPAIVRCGLIALAVAVISRPSLVLQRNRVDPSYVALAVDSSQSMAASEPYRDATLARYVAAGAGLEREDQLAEHSRWDLARSALLSFEALAIHRLLEHNGVQVSAFGGSLETLGFFDTPDATGAAVDALQEIKPDAPSTDVAAAIDAIIEKAQGRRLAGIVLVTDGQATQPTSLADALDLARGRQIPIYPVRIGSPDEVRDIEVGRPRAQESVFVDDVFAIEAPVTARGIHEPTKVTVRLLDPVGVVLDTSEVTIDPSQPTVDVELKAKPTRTGSARYRVEAAALADEASTRNNAERVDVIVLDNRLRVLYVEGYPRYEYRYLKNALMREKTVEVSVLLIEADEAFVQEGTDPIRRFPETPEELNRYDVVLFGDVDPRSGWLTTAQMTMLLNFVSVDGGGFGLVAGERAVPQRLLGTPLEKLLPVRIDPTFLGTYDAPLASGFQPRMTPEGRLSRILRFTTDREESQRLFDSLPELYWYARTLGPKPGASVLLEHPAVRTLVGQMPIVVLGRYGAGRLFFQAMDDTWRWRRHTGELLHDTYWVQVVRELMRGSRVAQDRRLVVRTDRRVYGYGEPVRASVDVFDPQLLAEQRDEITLSVTVGETSIAENLSRGLEPARTPTYLGVDSPTGSVAARFTAHRIGAESNSYEGSWIPPQPGSYAIEAADQPPEPGAAAAAAIVRVERPDLEGRRPEADHAVLDRIARATGGRVIELNELADAFGEIQNRSIQIPDDLVEPLWDSKLVLVLFASMILMEWVLRKVFGLL